MLKISPAENGHAVARLRLEGRLVGPWVAELKDVCVRHQALGHPPQLLLADVSYVDYDGLQLLAQLQRAGVVLEDCSPFVVEQLKSASRRVSSND